MLRSTKTRVGASQVWPALLKQPSALNSMAAGKSASAKIILGALPPNSSTTRLTVSMALVCTNLPARVEPVKDTKSTSG